MNVNNNVDGLDTTIEEPGSGSSKTYTISCTRGLDNVAKSIKVTKILVPTIDLTGRTDNSGPWEDAFISVNPGEELSLKWGGSNITGGCSGGGFETNNTDSGTNSNITEPKVGDSITYSVTCYGQGGSIVTDSLDVATVGLPTISAEPALVKQGGSATISWDTKGSGGCKVVGRDLPWDTLNSYSYTDSKLVTGFEDPETFTINCPSGSASVTVIVDQRIIEK